MRQHWPSLVSDGKRCRAWLVVSPCAWYLPGTMGSASPAQLRWPSTVTVHQQTREQSCHSLAKGTEVGSSWALAPNLPVMSLSQDVTVTERSPWGTGRQPQNAGQ